MFQPVLVAYRTWPWIVIAIRSFHEHFPGVPIVVVDNNPARGDHDWLPRCTQEQDWLRRQNDLVLVENPGSDRSAGKGIDLALDYCRAHDQKIMVHFEPDCHVTGTKWLEKLLVPIRGGAWMSGSEKRFYGPIHPTPSAWRTDIDWSTFGHCVRGNDELHPRFHDIFRLDALVEWCTNHEPAAKDWWKVYWDTAQRNWFCAATHDKAMMIEPTDDFEHFWYGSQRFPDGFEKRFEAYLFD